MYENKKGTRKNYGSSKKGSTTRKQRSVASVVKKEVKNYVSRIAETKKIDKIPVAGTAGIDSPYAVDITPPITQGSGETERIGLKSTLTGGRFELSITTQSLTRDSVRFKYWIVNNPDALTPLPAATVLSLFLDTNTFVPLQRDYHSLRNPDNLQSLKIVAQGRGSLEQEANASGTSYFQISRNLRLNLLQKYTNDASSASIMNRLYVIIVTDSGDTSVLTGLTVKCAMRYFHKDV